MYDIYETVIDGTRFENLRILGPQGAKIATQYKKRSGAARLVNWKNLIQQTTSKCSQVVLRLCGE